MMVLGQIPQPLQPWQTDPAAEHTRESGQRDPPDFLGTGQVAHTLGGEKSKMRIDNNQNVVAQVPQVQPKKEESNWKEDPCIQALVAERMQLLEDDARQEDLQGKHKTSGRFFTITESSNSVSYRRRANDSILVGPAKRRVAFDDLTPLQFCMGYVKKVNDTMDGLTRHFMMAEFFEILKLIEVTSWDVAKGAYISIMHNIKEGEISWHDRATLMQCCMTHTHSGFL